ncbi:hypothetical protein [Streptomyces fradiae]|uniref:hypothetical protein n=1 Tax=Streptomyces fradiae TaxID=1906 RepID=UPI00398870B2
MLARIGQRALLLTTAVVPLTGWALHAVALHNGQPIPPADDRTQDVRDRLHDPAAARDILDLDGLNPRVQDVVLNTPGARELLANLADYADLPAGPRRIAIGCAGGRQGQPGSSNSWPENSAPAAARSTSNTSTSSPRYVCRGPARGPLASGPGMAVAPCRWDDLGGGVTGSEGCRHRR